MSPAPRTRFINRIPRSPIYPRHSFCNLLLLDHDWGIFFALCVTTSVSRASRFPVVGVVVMDPRTDYLLGSHYAIDWLLLLASLLLCGTSTTAIFAHVALEVISLRRHGKTQHAASAK
jgi:hypothetical protein